MKSAIIVRDINKSRIIQFNRPEIRSPLSVAVLKEIECVLDTAAENPTVKTIIFTGTEDVFASGADLREIAGITADAAREFALRGQHLMNKIAGLTQTTVAAVNGFCFGGALDLAVSCDVRVASPNAVFCHPGVSLGIITGWSGTQRLPRLVRQANALEMLLTAKRVTADEALRIGLIDKITENPLDYSLANF